MTAPVSPASATVDVGRMLDSGSWSRTQLYLVALTALTIIFDGAENQLLGNALPQIMTEWSLPRTAFAPVLAAGLVGMMVGGALAGVIGDRQGRKKALLGSVLAFGLATIATGFSEGPFSLGLLRLMAGLGLGGAIPNAAALAAEFAPPRHRAIAVTLTIVCVPLGGTLAGAFAWAFLPILGWRLFFIVGGIVPVVVALALYVVLAESPRYLVTRPARWAELGRLLRRMGHPVPDGAAFVDRVEARTGRASVAAILDAPFRRDTTALWAAFFSCLLAVYLGFSWIPAMLTTAGFSAATGAAGIAAFNFGGVAGAVSSVMAFARFGSRATMLPLAFGAAAAAFAMAWIPLSISDPAATVVMLAIIGGLVNAVQTTMYALAADIYPTAIRATGVGSAAAVGRVGAILSSYVGAFALDAGGSRMYFIALAAAMMATFVALARISRHIPPRGAPAASR